MCGLTDKRTPYVDIGEWRAKRKLANSLSPFSEIQMQGIWKKQTNKDVSLWTFKGTSMRCKKKHYMK